MSFGLVIGTLAVVAFSLTLPLTRIALLASSACDVFALRLLVATLAAARVLTVARPLATRLDPGTLSPAARGAQFLPMALSVLYLGHPLPEH